MTDYFVQTRTSLAEASNAPYLAFFGYDPIQELDFFNVPGIKAQHQIKLNSKAASADPKPSKMFGGDVAAKSKFTYEPVSFYGRYLEDLVNGLVLRLPYGNVGDVDFQVDTPTPTGTAATDKDAITDAMAALLVGVAAGTFPAAGSGSRCFPRNRDITEPEITAALTDIFKADGTGFVSAAGILTGTAEDNGALNNFVGCMSYVLNTLPSPLIDIGTIGNPNAPMLFPLGAQIGLKETEKAKKLTVADHSTAFDAGDVNTGLENGFSITMQQGRNFDLQALGLGSYSISNNDTIRAIMPGGRLDRQIFHMVIIRSGVISGTTEFLVIPACTFDGVENNYDRDGIPQIVLTGKPQPVAGFESSSCPLVIRYTQFRAV
jgi:hypothetical protein